MSASDRDEALKELGRLVQEKRLDVQLSLEEIYERTRIRIEFLQGIEQGNYQGFPELVYTRGFVRTYLHVLGAENLKDEFMSHLSKNNSPKEKESLPTNVLGNGTPPTKGFKTASHLWLFAILLLTLAGAGGYAWVRWEDILLSLHPTTPVMVAYEPEASPDVPVVISGDWIDDILSSPDVASPEVVPPPEPVKPYLLIRPIDDIWLRVTIGDRVVLERTLRPGDVRSWDLPARARVNYGRVNAAEIVLNGTELGPVRGSRVFHYNPDGTYGQGRGN